MLTERWARNAANHDRLTSKSRLIPTLQWRSGKSLHGFQPPRWMRLSTALDGGGQFLVDSLHLSIDQQSIISKQDASESR